MSSYRLLGGVAMSNFEKNRFMKPKILIFIIALIVSACIGVDYLPDPVGILKIDQDPIALMPGDETQLTATYTVINEVISVDVKWSSLNPAIASISDAGLVTALGNGQAKLVASYLSASDTLLVTVESDLNAVASVEVTTATKTLLKNEMVTLTAKVKNVVGDELLDRAVTWFSENSNILTVNADGKVTAVMDGVASIHAKSGNVKSNVIDFVVGEARVGNFQQAGGYNAEGKATLSIVNGKLLLELSSDFKASFALGTFIYLSNSTNGASTFSNGLELGEITTNGSKTFDISSISPNTKLFDYRYVIILCKPARITFGFADLN